MPQLVVYMKVNAHNKDCYNLKNIVSKCGTHHIQTVVHHVEKDKESMKNRLLIILILTIATGGLFILLHSNNSIDKSVKIDKIVIKKRKRELQVYSNDKLIKTYKISLGRNPVEKKEFEGDKKTPEGQYIINDKNPNSGYHKNLGISYPNKQDIENAKRIGKNTGGQIKIHGIKNGFGWIGKLHLLMDWTAGCIAVTNEEIDELYDVIKKGTLIEIEP